MNQRDLTEVLHQSFEDLKIGSHSQTAPKTLEERNTRIQLLFDYLNTTPHDTHKNGWLIVFSRWDYFDSGQQAGCLLGCLEKMAATANLSGLIQEHTRGSALYWALHHPYHKFCCGEEILRIIAKQQPAFFETKDFAQAVCFYVEPKGRLPFETRSILAYFAQKRPSILMRLHNNYNSFLKQIPAVSMAIDQIKERALAKAAQRKRQPVGEMAMVLFDHTQQACANVASPTDYDKSELSKTSWVMVSLND